MTAMKCAPPSPPPVRHLNEIGSVLRRQLCAIPENRAMRVGHVAALVAFTPTVMRTDTRIRIQLDDWPTASWLTRALAHRDVELLADNGGGCVVEHPQILLSRYGFREGHWRFEQGADAAVGICRGALHAGAIFNRQGMKISCPTTALMLTLIAVMARLGITAKPGEREPRVAISPGEVPFALQRLGILDTGDLYTHLRQTPPSPITTRGQCA